MPNPSQERSPEPGKWVPLWITAIYLLVGGLWILLSDHLLEVLVSSPTSITRLQTAKGWFYVAGTGIMLYGLICKGIRQARSSSEQLRQTEERFRRRYEAISAGVVVQDTNGDIIYANRAASEILGVPVHRIIGRAAFDSDWEAVREDGSRFPPVEQPGMISIGTGEPVRGVLIGVYAPGTRDLRWILVNSEPIISADGRVEEAVSTFLEVTDRKEATEALKESEQRLASIIDFLPDATFAVNAEGRVIAWNKATEALTGAKAEDVLGKGDYEYSIPFYGSRRPLLVDLVLHPEAGDQVTYECLETRGRTLVAEVHTPALRPGGAYIWGIAAPLYDGDNKIVGAIESVRDVTDRREAEDALARSEARLRTLVENIPLDFWACDSSGKYTMQNKIDVEMWGDLNGLRPSETDVPPKIREQWVESIGRALAGETVREEVHIERNDEKRTYINIIAPIREDQRTLGLVGVNLDITDQKRAERELLERREAELRIQAEAEEAKRQFYKGTIFSVTDGKLVLTSKEEIMTLLAPSHTEISLEGGECLPRLRQMVERLCQESGMSEDRTYSLVTAVGEAAANAVKHAGTGKATVGVRVGRLQISIQDNGPGMDTLVLPKATLMRRYSTTTSMGLGYSLILASVDTVYLATDSTGTFVLMEKP